MGFVVRLSFVLLLLFIVNVITIETSSETEEEEEFTEELLLKPLPDRKVLAHFHFESKAPLSASNGRHHYIFPKAIAQLAQKFHIKEMEVSFTQGRWNYERWGGYDSISSSNAKPPGVELWAVFDVPQYEVDSMWKNLTHALSGIFCASINSLDSSTAYSSPRWSFRPASGKLRYGTLSREAICTENLTPWLKLLPCRDKAGLSSLMDRPSIYKGFYHSQRLRVTKSRFSSREVDPAIVLEQTLTIVLQPNINKNSITYSGDKNIQPSWSISSIFGRKLNGQCVLAKSSNVYLFLEKGLVRELNKFQEKHDENVVDFNNIWKNPGFDLSTSPSEVFKEVDDSDKENPCLLYKFPVNGHNESKPFDLGLTWKIPVTWSAPQAPLQATRFLMGGGNERGAFAISLRSKDSKERPKTNKSDERCKTRVDVFQVVPWFIKVYYHTLQIFVDEQPQAVADIVDNMHVSPSKDKKSPGMIEMILKLPCHVQRTVLTLEFDKGFRHIDEYPPDANQGFSIPSALISFPTSQTSIKFLKDDSLDKSPLFTKWQEKNPVQSYTEVLLVPLATPDFSMPYWVIWITCPALLFYFQSLLKLMATRRTFSEEERLLKSKAANSSRPHRMLSKKTKFKIILVVGVAIGWKYYFK